MSTSESANPQPNDEAQADDPLVTELDTARRELIELKERWMRAQAEFENARKRLRKEADEAGTRALARGIKPVLDEIDNLGRALEVAKPEAFAEFASGVAMISGNLASALAAQGITAIPCEGIFDPAVHEVIAEVAQAGVPRGTIVTVHRAGYRLRDQLVRSAQVIVAKEPPKDG
jgi:molecular chaperone GrpE